MTKVEVPDSFSRVPLAHRALHNVADGRPENSRAAICAAIEAGYGIEIDVQLSSDGEAMVFHDYHLERLTDIQGAVQLYTAAALRETPLRGSDEGIPDLPEVLKLVAGQVPLLIELKDQDGAMGTNIGTLERAIAEALVGYVGDVAVMSFNPNSVALMRELCPNIPRGIVTSAYEASEWPLSDSVCERLRAIPDYERVDASFISHEIGDLDRPRVTELKKTGAFICCWTVTNVEDEQHARNVADTITFEGYLAASPA